MLCPTCLRMNAKVQRLQLKYFEQLHRNGYQLAASPVLKAAEEMDEQRRALAMHQLQCSFAEKSSAA